MTAAIPTTPILQLFSEHCEILAAATAHKTTATGKAEDAEFNRLFYDKSGLIEDKMMALPCTCSADFAAKVIVDTCRGGLFPNWETGSLWIEARALTGMQICKAVNS